MLLRRTKCQSLFGVIAHVGVDHVVNVLLRVHLSMRANDDKLLEHYMVCAARFSTSIHLHVMQATGKTLRN